MSFTRVHRLLRLISLLQSSRTFTADELAEELGVSRRTFFRDLNILDLTGIPYGYDAKRHSYVIDQSYFLPSLNLTLEESLAILLVLRRVVSRESLPNFEAVTRAAVKIESSFPAPMQKYCRSMLQGVTVKFPPLVDASRVEQVFGKLQHALAEHGKIRIEYDSYFEGDTIETVIRPYQIHFSNRAWYLIGHSELHEEVRTFKLERITGLYVLEEKFEPDPGFSIDDHFGMAWNMIPEGRI